MKSGNNKKPANQQKQTGPAPPHSLEAETCVLGSLLLDNELIGEVLEVLSPEDFYWKRHRIIYETVCEIYDEHRPVDQVVLTEELETKGVIEEAGGPEAVMELVENVPSAAACMEYAEVVRGKAILRRLVHLCNTIAEKALGEQSDPDEILEEAERKIFKVVRSREEGKSLAMKDLLSDTIEQIETVRETGGLVPGISTGLSDLDEKLGGFRGGEFIVIAGRPGMGKTSLAQSICSHVAVTENEGIAFFSLEMLAEQISMNLLLAKAEVPPYKVKKGSVSEKDMKDITSAAGYFEDAPLYIDDSAAVSNQQLRARVRRLKSKHDISIVIVDYLQLMEGPKAANNRQEEIAIISRSLKGIARELDITMIALSQLNRGVEKRSPPRPKLADLRESGAIEQDADAVMLLYRDHYYTQDDETEGIAEIILAKHRGGPTGNIQIHFDNNLMTFRDLSMEPVPWE